MAYNLPLNRNEIPQKVEEKIKRDRIGMKG